jgi:anti-sigma regulatory factor (Ser/Thr protein kinase)
VLDMDEIITRLVGGEMELVIDIGSGVPSVLADRAQVEQIIMNLVINARDAMPHGGKVSVQTQALEVEGRMWALIRVADTGVGMDADTMERMFDPFFTTKGQHGTGLGLAMVYGCMRRHGGTMDIQSKLGAGTVVTLSLPLHEAGSNAQPETAGEDRKQILLVDDDASVLDLLSEELGLTLGDLPSPMLAAVASFLSFAVGALLPVLPYVLGAEVLWPAIVVSLAGLFLCGAVVTRLTSRPWWFGGLRQLGLGAAAAALTYGFGALVGAGLG